MACSNAHASFGCRRGHRTSGGHAPANRRTIAFVLSQPGVLALGLVGLGLLATRASVIAGLVCLGIAVAKAMRLLAHEDLDDRLRMRDDKHAHGVRQVLKDSEREEVMSIDTYANELEGLGADPQLVQSTRDEMWRIIKEHDGKDATSALRAFRQSLPPLKRAESADSGGGGGQSVRERIERELEILRATQREVEGL